MSCISNELYFKNQKYKRMSKLKDFLTSDYSLENGSIKLPKSLSIKPSAISKMYTLVQGLGKVNKGKFINQILGEWADVSKGKFEPKIEEAYLDWKSIIHLDSKKRIVSSDISQAKILELNVDELAFGRLIVKIVVPGIHPEFSPTIAVNVNEKGDQFGYGTNVNICSNLNILDAERIWSTYEKTRGAGGGYTKVDQKNILGQLKRYMKSMEKSLEEATKHIDAWKATPIAKDKFHQFIGQEHTKIAVANHHRKHRTIKDLTKEQKFLPVTGDQLSRISVEAAQPSYSEYEWNDDETNVWKIVNFGTGVIKPKFGSDMATLLRTNNNWINLINQRFMN